MLRLGGSAALYLLPLLSSLLSVWTYAADDG